MALLTAKQVVVRISVIILTAEFLIMLFLGAFSDSLNTYLAATLDVVILAAVASPAIYLWVIRAFVIARDDALAEVRALALTGPLTRMPNRRMVSLHLEKFISGSARHRVHGALRLIDLDGFKAINDSDGHDAGDAVLIDGAKRIQSITREADVAARLGGDEFVVFIDRLEIARDASQALALLLAERLIQVISDRLPTPENRSRSAPASASACSAAIWEKPKHCIRPWPQASFPMPMPPCTTQSGPARVAP